MEISPIDAPQVPAHFHLKLRQRFYQHFRKQENQNQKFSSSICLFKGITDLPKNYEDTNHYVEQQSTFWYLLGVKETGCYAVLNNNDESVVLFIPRFAEIYKMWMYVKPLEKFKSDYQVQKVLYVDELQQYLKDQKPSQIYLFAGIDSDSKLQVPQPEQIYTRYAEVINTKTLWLLISNLRAIKTEDEIQLMKYVCRLTTEAHIKVMKSAKPGLKQIQMHSLFHFDHSIHSGCLDIGFPSICSSGQDCATLHYIENDKIMQPGQMLLHDMGGKWYGYCADQAITFPIDGKFTEKQKKIYNAVYEAQKIVLETLKAGVNWQDMHLLAEKVILEHLIAIGIINKFDMKELQDKRVGAIFFPHGLGHFLGLRVHDLGGYTSGPKRSEKAGLKNLRTLRDMEQGMIITVEPGCYFIDFIIRNALQDPEMNKYLNEDKINQYREVGGVRLEDDVVVRKDGIEMLSSLPRKWQEVEKLLVDKLK